MSVPVIAQLLRRLKGHLRKETAVAARSVPGYSMLIESGSSQQLSFASSTLRGLLQHREVESVAFNPAQPEREAESNEDECEDAADDKDDDAEALVA
eukprot:706051-Rhodomonas_salina.2